MPDLPDFFVVGAMKSATTSLFHYVVQHPEVFEPADKEPAFFSSDGRPPAYTGPGDMRLIVGHRRWDEPSYRSLFSRPEGLLAGDFSTVYLALPEVPDRVLAAVPDAAIVVLLRDPVARAFSAWKMWRSLAAETLSFPDALAAEDRRREEGYAPVWRYREMGRYGEQVSRWMDRAGDDRVLVLVTDDLARDPATTMRRLYTHIGADPSFVPDTERRLNVRGAVPRNTGVEKWMRNPRSRSKRLALRVPTPLRRQAGRLLRRSNAGAPVLDPVVADELRRGYADDLEVLMARTGIDVAHWLPGGQSKSVA